MQESSKSGVIHGIGGALVAALLYMRGIDWDFSLIDYDRALEWIGGMAALLGITNKRNLEAESPKQKAVSVDSSLPQGIRTNNPGNLRPLSGGQKWQGQSGILETKNGRYLQFESAHHGIRAAARNLKNQQRLHSLRTIESIIGKWAPASDNNHTASYIAFVSGKTGFDANNQLDLEDDKTVVKLLKAIMYFENGVDYYSTSMIFEGVKAA